MSDALFGTNFKIAVSDKKSNKLGMGGSAQNSGRLVYFYAFRQDAGDVEMRALNGNFHPSGEPRVLGFEEFLDRYRPEPLLYFNRVRPAMETVEADLARGEGHLEAGRPDLAEKSFRKVLDVDEDNIRGVFGLGLAYLGAGKLDDAEEILGKLMNLELAFAPEHVHLFNRFGIQMRKAGMHRQALDYYGKALDINPSDEHLHFNVCRIHYDAGEVETALECLGKALELNPGFNAGADMLRYIIKRNPHLAEAAREEEPAARPAPEPELSELDLALGGSLPPEHAPKAPPQPVNPRYAGFDLDDLPWD